jgi:hypothetical protein
MGSLISNQQLILAIILFIAGLIDILIILYYWLKSIESKKWETTNGKILTSDVSKMRDTNEGDSILYKPEICYSYNVFSEKYISNRIRILFNYYSSSSLRSFKLTNKYPKDSNVVVFYNPNKPSEAVLEPGLKMDLIIVFVLALLFGVVSFYFSYKNGIFDLIKIINK